MSEFLRRCNQMNIKQLLTKDITKKIICITLLLVLALLSIFVVSKYATSPENYKSTIESIDEKKATVMGLTATAATASTYSIDSIHGANTRCMSKKSLDLELSAARNINATSPKPFVTDEQKLALPSKQLLYKCISL